MNLIITPSPTRPTARQVIDTVCEELLALQNNTKDKSVLKRADCLMVELAHDLYLHSEGRQIDLDDRAMYYNCKMFGLWRLI